MTFLGLTYPTTREELRSAYRRAARRLHPDAGGAAAEFVALQREYQRALSDPATFRKPPQRIRFTFPKVNLEHTAVATPPEEYSRWTPPPPPPPPAPQPGKNAVRNRKRLERRKRAKLRRKLQQTPGWLGSAAEMAEAWIIDQYRFYLDVGYPVAAATFQAARDRERLQRCG